MFADFVQDGAAAGVEVRIVFENPYDGFDHIDGFGGFFEQLRPGTQGFGKTLEANLSLRRCPTIEVTSCTAMDGDRPAGLV
jgi:hypothetical protein